MAAVKSLPALIFSADYIVLLVLLDQGVYYENSKIVISLDSLINNFIIFV